MAGAEAPSYSPDGRYIVYASSRDGDGKALWIMSADGHNKKRISTSAGDYMTPAWERR